MDRFAQRKLTLAKRETQTCKVYEVKIDRSKLTKQSKEHLIKLFIESKWFYNYCLSNENINDASTTITSVPVKVGEVFENRILIALSSQMKQGIKTRTFNSMSSLKALKQNGHPIGKLKFKSYVNSIPLKQFKNTHHINKSNKSIRLQGMKQWLRVEGLSQIPENAEIANAVLVQNGDEFYLHITTYANKESINIPNEAIGIDFGCETQLAFYEGTKIEFQVLPTKRLKRLDRKISNNKNKRSKKRLQNQRKRQKEYEHLTNRKKDIRNKVVNAITKHFKFVCFQDESIHAWHSGRHGKKIQHTGIGGILSDLKHKSHTPSEVDKFFPSTQLCPDCGQLNKLSLDERTYICDCGFKQDRDAKSAFCILVEGMKKIPTEHRKFTARETLPSAFLNILDNIHGIKVSKVESLI